MTSPGHVYSKMTSAADGDAVNKTSSVNGGPIMTSVVAVHSEMTSPDIMDSKMTSPVDVDLEMTSPVAVDSVMTSPVDVDSEMTAPVDGGYGWVIVLAGFLINVVVLGCAGSFGVVMVPLLEHFKSTKTQAAWIGSIQAFLLDFTGK